MEITKDQALAELAKRELSKRQATQQKPEEPVSVQRLQSDAVLRSVNALISGPGGATTTAELENGVPAVMGGIGAVLGGQVGHPNAGLGIGTATGKVFQDVAKKLKGTGEDVDIEDALILGGVAALGGKAFDVTLKSVGLSTKLIPEKARAAFFDKALQAVNVGKMKLMQNWRVAVDTLVKENPEKTVNLTQALTGIKAQLEGVAPELVPQIKTAIKRNPKFNTVIKMLEGNGDEVVNLSLKDAQELKNALTSTGKTMIKRAKKGGALPSERPFFELIDTIDEKIVESFPGMLNVKQAYKQGIEAFKMARPLVEPGKAVESSIFNKPQGLFGLGGTPLFGSTQGKLAAEKIMSETVQGAKFFKAIKLAHNLNRASDAVSRLFEIAVGGAVLRKTGLGEFGKN